MREEKSMDLIKCPKCGKEINSDEKKCMQCGFEFVTEEAEKKYCPKCNYAFDENTNVCPNCGCFISNDCESISSSEKEEKTEDSVNNIASDIRKEEKRNRKNKKIILSIIGIVVILCIAVFAFISNRNAKIREKQEAEVVAIKEYNNYIDSLNSLYSNSLSGASDAESICVLVLNVWQDAIYGDTSDETSKYVSGASDFNEALQRVYNDKELDEQFTRILEAQDASNTYIQNLQSCPPELSKAYDAALEVHTTFSALADLALSPKGNYNSVSAAEKDKVDSFMTAFKTLAAIIPEKKEVPLYDAKGKPIKDEFYFDRYLNQMSNKLPETVETVKAGSYELHADDVATICGVDGELSYINGNGVISGILWKTENVDEQFVEKVLNKLREKYGEEYSTEDNSYYWETEDKKLYITMIIGDEELTLHWS